MDKGPTKDQIQCLTESYRNKEYINVLSQSIYLLGQFPKSILLYNFIAMSHTELGSFEAAIRTYTTIVTINPKDSNGYFNLANIHMDTENFELAISGYQTLLEMNPNDHEACHNMGVCWKQLGNIDNAIVSFKRAVDINPEFKFSVEELDSALKEKSNSGSLSNK